MDRINCLLCPKYHTHLFLSANYWNSRLAIFNIQLSIPTAAINNSHYDRPILLIATKTSIPARRSGQPCLIHSRQNHPLAIPSSPGYNAQNEHKKDAICPKCEQNTLDGSSGDSMKMKIINQQIDARAIERFDPTPDGIVLVEFAAKPTSASPIILE